MDNALLESHRKFAFEAAPPRWYEMAKLLREQAFVLHVTKSIKYTEIVNKTRRRKTRYTTNRSVFLLAGFSLENLIKAYLVLEDPSLTAHGTLARRLRTHRLSRLWGMSKLVPYKARYSPLLTMFEDGLESWARYPCALTHDGPNHEGKMTEGLWIRYNRMFETCGKRLEKLLTVGWDDFYGGQYRMVYEYDETGHPLSTRNVA